MVGRVNRVGKKDCSVDVRKNVQPSTFPHRKAVFFDRETGENMCFVLPSIYGSIWFFLEFRIFSYFVD